MGAFGVTFTLATLRISYSTLSTSVIALSITPLLIVLTPFVSALLTCCALQPTRLIMQLLKDFPPSDNVYVLLIWTPSSMVPLTLRLLTTASPGTESLKKIGKIFSSLGISSPTKPLHLTFLNTLCILVTSILLTYRMPTLTELAQIL